MMRRSLEGVRAGADAHDTNADRAKNNLWIVVSVPGESNMSLAYTVGLQRKQLPELIMTGLPSKCATPLINACADQMIKRGVPFATGTAIRGIANFRLSPVKVAEAFRVKRKMQGEFGMHQLVMSDAHGLFPWNGGFDRRLHAAQPLLCEEPYRAPVMVIIQATCHDSGSTARISCTVDRSVIEDLMDCRDFVQSMLPATTEKWVRWDADLFDGRGEKIGWTTSFF